MIRQTNGGKSILNMICLAMLALGATQCTTPQTAATSRTPGPREEGAQLQASPGGAMIREGDTVPHYEDCDPVQNIGEAEDGEEQGAQVEVGVEVKLREKGQDDDGKPHPYTRYKCRR